MQQIESKEKHRLDIYLRYLDPENKKKPQLTAAQKESLDLMYKARHWQINNFFGPAEVRKMLQEEGNEKRSYSRACQILMDSDYLFGNIEKINKSAVRTILYEFHIAAIAMIKADSETSGTAKGLAISKIAAEIAELTGAKDFSESVDPKLAMPAQNVIMVPVGVQVNVKR